MQFGMSYENVAGKLIITESKNNVVAVNFKSHPSFSTDLEGLSLHKESMDKLHSVAETVCNLLKTGNLTNSVLMYSYIRSGQELFTPYVCLSKQYCLGMVLDSSQLAVVTYGEIFGEYIASKRKEHDKELFWDLLEQLKNKMKVKDVIDYRCDKNPSFV